MLLLRKRYDALKARLPAFLEGERLRAIMRAVVFGLLLLYVQASGYSGFSLLLFISWSLFIYLTPVSRTYSGTIAWISLVSLALIMPSRFTLITPYWAPHPVLPEHVFAFIFAALCFLYTSITLGSIGYRERWYEVLHAGLVWGVSLLFTAGVSGMHPVRAMILGTVFIAALTIEYIRMHGQSSGKVIRFAGALLAMQFLQLAWAIRFLPLSVGSAAVLLALVVVMSTAATEQYLRGTLRGRFLRHALTLLVGASCAVALLSRWVL